MVPLSTPAWIHFSGHTMSRLKRHDSMKLNFLVQLHGPLQKFDSPTLLGGLDISIQAPEVSFTAWVKFSREFSKGYIFRKRLHAAGFGSDRSCWALFFSHDKGPELRYGI